METDRSLHEVVEADQDEERARQLLAAEYGLDGELVRLPGENLNYLVTASGQRRYVLKVASAERDNAMLDMEYRAVEFIAERSTSLRVPRSVLTRCGNVVAQLNRGARDALRAQLLDYVAGTPWGELVDHDDGLLADLGMKLAKLDLLLADFTHPAMYRTHQWDLSALSQHRSTVGLITDPYRRRVLEWVFHYWAAVAEKTLDDLPRAFIHSDANDENLLVENGRVVGLLVFGDSLYNPVVCNLAITLAYAMLGRDDPLPVAGKVVSAYHHVRPLSEDERRALYPMVCGRLANTVAVAAGRRLADPGHRNWFVTEDGAWKLLEKFYESSPATKANYFFTRFLG